MMPSCVGRPLEEGAGVLLAGALLAGAPPCLLLNRAIHALASSTFGGTALVVHLLEWACKPMRRTDGI